MKVSRWRLMFLSLTALTLTLPACDSKSSTGTTTTDLTTPPPPNLSKRDPKAIGGPKK